VTTGDTGRVRYELVATFACEGTVGSVAVGNVDTVQSFDDGSALFFPLSLLGFLLSAFFFQLSRNCFFRLFFEDIFQRMAAQRQTMGPSLSRTAFFFTCDVTWSGLVRCDIEGLGEQDQCVCVVCHPCCGRIRKYT
jgi:hypothetical protein